MVVQCEHARAETFVGNSGRGRMEVGTSKLTVSSEKLLEIEERLYPFKVVISSEHHLWPLDSDYT